MIRRLFVLGALAGALSLTAACGTDLPVTVNVDTSAITGGALDIGLTQQGFTANATKTEYTKGDVVILVTNGKPSGVRYHGQNLQDLQNCKLTVDSTIAGAATSALGGSQQEVTKSFCGS